MTGSDVVRHYHEETKHSPESVAADRHGLDWANQPLPFKVYEGLDAIPLPTEIVPTGLPAMDVLTATAPTAGGHAPMPIDLSTLARLCILSNGVTRVRRYPGGDLAFRAAGTTGALYHVELYLACADLPDLPAGVYHFGAHDNRLRRLRSSDHRRALVDASGGEESLAHARVIVLATSTFWRNAWKYRARAWRHTFWDTGTVLANLLALAQAARLPARVVLGFADAPVNALLDLDPAQEVTVCLVAVGRGAEDPPPPPPVSPLHLSTLQLSDREVLYPLIEEAQAATSLQVPDEARAWGSRIQALTTVPHDTRAEEVRPLPATDDGADAPIERVIQRRGSSRRFHRLPVGMDALTAILRTTQSPVDADFVPAGASLSDLFVIVNAVDGLESGAYRLVEEPVGLVPVRIGDHRQKAGFLALGQDLGADASANLYWLADLERVVEGAGGRGYRATQLEAAIRAGRAWLAAYAVGLGATGLTFFDDEVVRFFGQDPGRMGVMFLLAIGRRGRWTG